jgi:hypothetical protein
VSTRVSGLFVLPSNVAGEFRCGPGQACPDVLLPVEADASVLAVVADVMVSPFPAHRVRPYTALGAGLKRYAFSWPDAPAMVQAGEHTETALTLRAGLGVEVDLAATRLHAEVADVWSGRGPVVASDPQGRPGAGLRRRAQHDIALSLGVQLLRF